VDNLAHTLVGAALGRAVAGRRVPAAGWIGAIAANAPDWTELLIGFRPSRGNFAYYTTHRGITHSFLGAAIEIVGIVAVVWSIFVLLRRSRDGSASLVRTCAVVGVCVLSHLYMDWQGSYGLRPFLPWSGHWYYADWVAIVDPLFWLVPLLALAWGAERHWRDLTPIVLVVVFVLFMEFVLRPDDAIGWLKVLSVLLIAIGAIGWVRHWFGPALRHRAAAFGLLVLAVYATSQAVASRAAKSAAQRAAIARFGPAAQSAALTRVGTPFQWTLILASPESVAGPGWAISRRLDDSRVHRALTESSQGRAFGAFARFLAAEVDSGSAGVTVTLRDARYALPPATGWGVVSVPLTAASQPTPTP